MAKNAGCALVALLAWLAVTEAKPSMNIVHQCAFWLDLRVNAALNILQMQQLRLESLLQAFHFLKITRDIVHSFIHRLIVKCTSIPHGVCSDIHQQPHTSSW